MEMQCVEVHAAQGALTTKGPQNLFEYVDCFIQSSKASSCSFSPIEETACKMPFDQAALKRSKSSNAPDSKCEAPPCLRIASAITSSCCPTSLSSLSRSAIWRPVML